MVRGERVDEVHERLAGRIVDYVVVILVEGPAAGSPDLLTEARGDEGLFAGTKVEAKGVVGELANFGEFGGPKRAAGRVFKRGHAPPTNRPRRESVQPGRRLKWRP